MTGTRIDEGWLVWVAARATRTDPQDVLDHADMRALVTVIAEMERAGPRAPAVAAAALVAVARQQPFRIGNRATAWMAAAVVLADAGVPVRLSEEVVAGLVADAQCGALRADDVCRILSGGRDGVRPEAGRGRRLSMPCPVCGRALHAYEEVRSNSGPVMVSGDDFELTARCWYEHRAHDRAGRPLDRPRGDYRFEADGDAGESWRLVVRDDRSGSMLVLVDERAVLLRPSGGRYLARAHHGLTIGDLAGSWDRLHDSGEPLGVVLPSSVRLDAGGGMLEWRRLAAALDAWDRTPAASTVGA